MSIVWLLISLGAGAVMGFIVGRQSRPEAPLFTEDELEVDTRLLSARQAVGERIQKRLDRIMTAAEAEGKITNDGVEDLFCISDRTASTYLSTLTKEGRLERKGVGRGTYYEPNK
jgi:Fic family protein